LGVGWKCCVLGGSAVCWVEVLCVGWESVYVLNTGEREKREREREREREIEREREFAF